MSADPRFARLKTDPRFRRPRKKQSKLTVDERFKGLFQTEQAHRHRVDKYGRRISGTHERDNLSRFYRLENGDDRTPVSEHKTLLDYARGDVLLESSDEDGDADDIDAESRDVKAPESDESDSGDLIVLGRDPIAIAAQDEAEIDLNEDALADLDAQAVAYDKSHPEIPREEGARTHRLAVVNLDWDHVRANHLFKIFSSLLLPSAPAPASSSAAPTHHNGQRSIKAASSNVVRGKVLGVRVYPSEFGKERLLREEQQGPPIEVFKTRKNDREEEVNEQNIYEVGDDGDYDEDALRTYQLERLRYYYAIVTCDTVDAASYLYSELEGTELERSANVFDLSFVPDDMTFDDDYRDEASENIDINYKSIDFVTDALRHSKVKLTWDEDNPERSQITRRTLSRQEIEEADFKAYLASATSDSESDASQPHPPRSKTDGKEEKTASRNKLRALLLGSGNDELPEGWGQLGDDDTSDIDMEITFTPGLSESKGDNEETTLDKYQRKLKEKRRKRKDEVNGKKAVEKENNGGAEDYFFEVDSGGDSAAQNSASQLRQEASKKKQKHKNTKEKQTSHVVSPRRLVTTEELSLLTASDNPNTEPKHFDMKSVLQAEKKSKGMRRKKKGPSNDNEVQEDFTIDVKDDRFKALHEDHAFAIDPSNPHFKRTKSMTALLDERAMRQKEKQSDPDAVGMKRTSGEDERSLKNLVDSVKRKSVAAEQTNPSKRKKI